MASCRQIARAGQLILNGGKWLGGRDGETVVQLLDEQYAKQMLRPAKLGAVEGYGFLAWLNTDMRDGGGWHEGVGTTPSPPPQPPSAHCCGPRWIGRLPPPLGSRQCAGELCGTCCVPRNGTPQLPCDPQLPVLLEGGESVHERDPAEYVARQIVGDSFPEADRPTPGPLNPPDLAMAMGAYAKCAFAQSPPVVVVCYVFLELTHAACIGHNRSDMFILPSTNTLVVSMGFTFGKSMGCPGGYVRPVVVTVLLDHRSIILTFSASQNVKQRKGSKEGND